MSTDPEIRTLALAVRCPTCHAEPGQACDYRGSVHDRDTHLARQDRGVRKASR